LASVESAYRFHREAKFGGGFFLREPHASQKNYDQAFGDAFVGLIAKLDPPAPSSS
jgi:hypothetical protein